MVGHLYCMPSGGVYSAPMNCVVFIVSRPAVNTSRRAFTLELRAGPARVVIWPRTDRWVRCVFAQVIPLQRHFWRAIADFLSCVLGKGVTSKGVTSAAANIAAEWGRACEHRRWQPAARKVVPAEPSFCLEMLGFSRRPLKDAEKLGTK